MHHNDVMWQVNRERHAALNETAARHRLVNSTRVVQPSRKARLLVNLGVLLVDVGLKLKTRYEPVNHWTGSFESS